MKFFDMAMVACVEYPIEIQQVRDKTPIIVEAIGQDQYIIIETMSPFVLRKDVVYTKQLLLDKAAELCSVLVEDARKKYAGKHFCWMKGAIISPTHTPSIRDENGERVELGVKKSTTRKVADITSFHQGRGLPCSMRYVCEFGLSGTDLGGSFLYIDDLTKRWEQFVPVCPGPHACRFLIPDIDDAKMVCPPDEWDKEEPINGVLFDDKNACDGDCLYEDIFEKRPDLKEEAK